MQEEHYEEVRSAVMVKNKLNNWFNTMAGSRQGDLIIHSNFWSCL